MPQYPHKVYNTRDQNGIVKTGKKNFYTNNPKKGKGNTTNGNLFASYPYMGSPYDNPKDLDTVHKFYQAQLANHKAKIINGPFKNTVKGQPNFTPDVQVHYKPPQPETDPNAKQKKPDYPPWRYNNPAKKGYNKTLQPFPKYIQQGQKAKGKKKPDCDQAVWIPNFNGTSKDYNETLAKPNTVPSQMVLNVKKYERNMQ